ncbi:FAD binding domain-containing protein [Streptomyces sp. NPDC102406]|uniref:FAD binding domain-containing protein n=1 Tax=Streptomyces sp. NPDC102406 TaxID=3366171 RepID=UPI0038272A75
MAGGGYLAGGTALYAEPRPGLRRLRDVTACGWPPLTVTADGIAGAATCTITELLAFAEAAQGPRPTRRRLIARCCRAFSSSLKVWNTATVGGNLCAALPAAPMVSLAVALRGTCRVRDLGGRERDVPAADFVTARLCAAGAIPRRLAQRHFFLPVVWAGVVGAGSVVVPATMSRASSARRR